MKLPVVPAFELGVWNAWLFMSVFLLQMIPMLFVDKSIWKRSHIPTEARNTRLDRYAAIVGNLVWLLAMGYSVFLPLQPGSIWFYVGLSAFILGSILMAIATFNFITTRAGSLITRGAYQLSRHPMYLATFFICLGSGIASLSWLFIFLSLIMAFCFRQEALIEERYCLKEFGRVYQDYMSSVPRWLGLPNGR